MKYQQVDDISKRYHSIFRKPIIPDDVKNMFVSAGLDEQKAAELVVYSNLDTFKETCLLFEPASKERLKEVRRRGKNISALQSTRKNEKERIGNLRNRIRRASIELNEKQTSWAKCKV